jgi:hypothetical protein
MPIANEIIVGPGFIPTITAGIAAASDFDTVRVLPGTYNEGTIFVNKSIQLLGAQAGVDARNRIGVPESRVVGPATNLGDAIFIVQADNVVIDGFTIEENTNGPGITLPTSAGAPLSGHWIFNNIIRNNVFGLYLNSSGTNYTQVRNNFFDNNNQPGAANANGIYTDQGLSNALIDSNLFKNHLGTSINFAFAGIPANHVVVSRNQITDAAIRLLETDDIKIYDNIISSQVGSGIFFAGGTNRTEIEGNQILNNLTRGIAVTISDVATPNTNIRAKHNSIVGNPVAGLGVDAGAYDEAAPSRFLDATENWWGSPTGPTNPSNPAGTGDAVVDPDDVSIFIPFLRDNPLQEPPGTCVINPLVREASAPTRTFVAATKAAAVTAARTNAGTLAQAIGNLPGVWPEIRDYEAPNNASLFGEPAIVWEDFTAAPGELRYFSQAFQDVSNFPTSHVVFATVFTDNAHRLFIEEYDAAGTLVQSITPSGGLNDGIMLAAAGTTTDTTPPLNWQKIRQYSKVFTPTQSGNFIVITVEALNYNSLGPNNPAGVSFVADFYKTTP